MDFEFRGEKCLIFGNLWAFDFVVQPNNEIHEIKCPMNINTTTVTPWLSTDI